LSTRLGLFNHVLDVKQARLAWVRGAIEAAVSGNGISFNDFRAKNRGFCLLECFNKLFKAALLGINNIVGKNDCKWFIPNELLGLQNGVPEAEGFGWRV